MTSSSSDPQSTAEDVRTLGRFGYQQELTRVLGGFSNFAVSLSIICILAGGLTSFHVGYSSVGGAAIGLGWPLMGVLSLAVAATMAQIASAFPTAGGLYHWASLLGGRGWGWATAWFNLLGLVSVLAAINVGTVQFAAGGLYPDQELTAWEQLVGVAAITLCQALLNHLGVRVTRILTDFSGWWILGVSTVLTISLFAYAQSWEWERLLSLSNFSGRPEGDAPIWPRVESIGWLFALGLLLPAYTITGFDASAHIAEETVHATVAVPRGIVRSVAVSVLVGWVMLGAIVLAMPDPIAAADQGDKVFFHTLRAVCPNVLAVGLLVACIIAQFLCGLATVTSASRMAFAFARDGGLPASRWVRRVSPRFRSPSVAIWVTSFAAILFTAYAKFYTTIAAVCVIFLYVSYVLPTAAGLIAYGRSWTSFGPWTLGRWFRPLAIVSIVTCLGLIVIGMQPPNERALPVVLGTVVLLTVGWFGYARKHFPGPPVTSLSSPK